MRGHQSNNRETNLLTKKGAKESQGEDNVEGRGRLARRARCNKCRAILRNRLFLAVWSKATEERNDPPVSLPRRFRVEPVDQFFSCQVLQLLTLEAASQKRLSLSLSIRSKPLRSK